MRKEYILKYRFIYITIIYLLSINISSASVIFTDNFNDGDFSDWSITGSGWTAIDNYISNSKSSTCYNGNPPTVCTASTEVVSLSHSFSSFTNPNDQYYTFIINASGHAYASGTNPSKYSYQDFIFQKNGTSEGAYIRIDSTGNGVSRTISGSGFSYSPINYPGNQWLKFGITITNNNVRVDVLFSNGTLYDSQIGAFSTGKVVDPSYIKVVSQSYSYCNQLWHTGYAMSEINIDDISIYSENPGTGVVISPATVNLNMVANISYSMYASDFTNFDYSIDTYDAIWSLTSTSISSLNGSIDYDTIGKTEGTYTIYLVATRKTTGVKYYLSYDTMFVDSNVAIYGYTKDAITGVVIPITNVNLSQLGTWYNTTSDGSGFYTLTGMQSLYPIAINSSKLGYVHFDYSYTPSYDYNYSVDLYLWNITVHSGNTGIEGLTLASPFASAIGSVTVTLWNSTDTFIESSSASGYFSHTLYNQTDSFSGNASKSGYVTTDTQVESITNLTWSQMIFILNPEYHVTIRVKDSVSNGYLSTFTTSLDCGSNNSIQTTTIGTSSYDVGQGLCYITGSAEGYFGSGQYYLITADRNIELTLTPLTSNPIENINVVSSIHDVQFIVTNISGYRFKDLTVTGNDTAGTTYSGITGDGGSVVFKMNSTQKSNLRFVGTGVDINWTEYPIGYVYHIYVTGNGTIFETVLITNTTLTNYTILYTNRSWSMQNLTSGYLNSTLGIGPMGQGILIGLMSWVLMSAGGIVTVLLAMAVVSLLGLISWVLTLFIAMTVIALFVLLGGIGQSW